MDWKLHSVETVVALFEVPFRFLPGETEGHEISRSG